MLLHLLSICNLFRDFRAKNIGLFVSSVSGYSTLQEVFVALFGYYTQRVMKSDENSIP